MTHNKIIISELGARQKSLLTSFFDAKLASGSPPQATIGLQRSVLPDVGDLLLYCVCAFYESNLTSVSLPFIKSLLIKRGIILVINIKDGG